MTESFERRRGMSEDELKRIAKAVTEALEQSSCSLTPEEQTSVKELLKTKKQAAKMFLYIFGAVLLWILKDAYYWIADHITLIWGK